VAGADVFGGHVEIVHADHADDGGLLNDGNNFVAESGDDIFDGLRSDNFKEDGGIFKTEGKAGFGLAFVDG